MRIAQESTLEAGRMKLRKMMEDDADDVMAIFSDKEMFRYTNSNVDLSADSFSIGKSQALAMIESWNQDSNLILISD